jgi:2-polyprenyl-6-methoxyphenol hydroxylase-like FAD-dependent oxidoreductase
VAAGSDFDVVVAGASIAGCAAARLFALAGARVALVEKRPDPDAYKVVCTHQIQPSAVGTIERIGLAPLLDEAGAVRSKPAAWNPHGGWLRFPPDALRGYGVTRRTLDPMLRRLALDTPGVEGFLGRSVVDVIGGSRVGGVEVEGTDGRRTAIRAALTVAADGSGSKLARLARVPGRVRPNARFSYFGYWRGVKTPHDEARVWMLDPEAAAVFPNEDGLALIAVVPVQERLAEFRSDPEAAYLRMLRALPEGPDLSAGERVSKLIGKLEIASTIRPAARPGIAFVGDAALATDPLYGVGCGWAFQTAEWLAEETAPALLGDGSGLDAALDRYRRVFLRRLGPHHLQIADYSTGRPMRRNERMMMRAAGKDPVVGSAVEQFVTRQSSVLPLLDPRLSARVLLRQGSW